MNLKKLIFPIIIVFLLIILSPPVFSSDNSKNMKIRKMIDELRAKRDQKLRFEQEKRMDNNKSFKKSSSFVDVNRQLIANEIYKKEYKYIIGPGDNIELSIYGEADLSTPHLVGPDGSITMPIFGRFEAAGSTQEELAKKIRNKMLSIYRDPKVVVIVKEYNNNFAIALGRIASPGKYNFANKPSLLELISLAGGVTPISGGNEQTAGNSGSANYVEVFDKAIILRGKDQIIEVDLDKLLREGVMDLNIPLRSGDIVYIPKTTKRIYVLGQVSNPGMKIYEENMTLMQAISIANQATVAGNLKRVRIIRGNSESPEIFHRNISNVVTSKRYKPFFLKPGDIVYVPQKGSEKFKYNVTWLTTSISTILLGNSLVKLIENN